MICMHEDYHSSDKLLLSAALHRRKGKTKCIWAEALIQDHVRSGTALRGCDPLQSRARADRAKYVVVYL
jgi:hypothetical protein